MRSILIIIGNSHVRWRFYDSASNSNSLGAITSFKTSILKKPSCFSLSAASEGIADIYGVSVVPRATALLTTFADKHDVALHMFGAENYPFANLTDEPTKVGTDRLLAVLGARQLQYQPPLVIIDMGTATTANFVDKDWGFEGGLIMPSSHLMATSLHQQTEQLPTIDTAKKTSDNVFIGKNTDDAMAKGVNLLGDSALEKIIAGANRDGRKVVLTGGAAKQLVKDGFKNPSVAYEPDLLFHGLVYFLSAR
ncbi:MAG: type III pantothenate kinase [Hydrotalea sp.]|nr:type III pantothenate kinase [Hydrotalea sp.]